MNKIEIGTKLDFSNVLIRPKRSTINSRSEVSLEREITFRVSKQKWKGVPIISANMDTTGTFEVYNCLKKHKIVTAFHKFYKLEDFQNMNNLYENYFVLHHYCSSYIPYNRYYLVKLCR